MGFMNTMLEVLGWAGSVVFVVFFIGLCIFVHELGHFMVAKWRGLHIDAFALGFRKVWSKKVNGIEYRIGWLPFGGYVELPQVDSSEAHPKAADGTELPPAKPLDRILTAAAGPICNIIFGLFLGCFIWLFGMPMDADTTPMDRMLVTSVIEDSPEYAAGLRQGDVIAALNEEPFECSWREFAQRLMLQPGLAVKLDVLRDGDVREISYTASLGLNPAKPRELEFEGMPWPFFTVNVPVEFRPNPGSALADAGMRPHELVTAINGYRHSDLIDMYRHFQPEDGTVVFTVLRDGVESELPPVALPAALTRYLIGITMDGAKVAEVNVDRPAIRAGILAGDTIVALNGTETQGYEHFYDLLQENGEKPCKVTVRRGGETLTFELTPVVDTIWEIPAELAATSHPTPFKQLEDTVRLSYKSLRGMMIYLANQVGVTETTSAVKPRNMSAIVGIATILFTASNHSFMMGLYFVVVVSFALAIFNLLPLPVLDGGHIFFSLIEIIFRRPLPRSLIRVLSYLFVGILIGFMLYVTFYDIRRLVNRFVPETVQPAVEAPEDGE